MTRVVIDARRLRQLVNESPELADRAMAELAFTMEAAAKTSMQEPKSGLVYDNHVASAPSEAPAIDTGNLFNSINVRKERMARYAVQDGTDYGIFLEYGTRRMAARPFMRPAFQKVAAGAAEIVAKVIED